MILTTCQVGQTQACGEPANNLIAVVRLVDSVWVDTWKPGGVIPLCDFHANTPTVDWDKKREGTKHALENIKTHNNAPVTSENLRWAATHEALARSWIFDVLTGLADRIDDGSVA
jgi:hypothetical protein